MTSGADGFSRYLPEILRAEGLNEFDVADVGQLSGPLLASHGVVVLGSTPLSGDQAATLTAWVQAGGNLVAIKPSTVLAPLLGLAYAGGSVSNASVLAAPGSGVTAAAMQFHGAADLYALSGASAVATLADAGSASGRPAATLRSVGGAGGQAAAFTYDLPQSVVLTRQGNPAWADQERDFANPPPETDSLRSDELFFPDWVDLARVQVPSADEQQRLLANLIVGMQQDRMPLPRFWYLPWGLKAAVVMTGDDHAQSVGQGQTEGTVGQFTRNQNVYSAPGCSVADWQCVRSTSYLFPGAAITNSRWRTSRPRLRDRAAPLEFGHPDGSTNVGNQSCNNATLQSTAADLSLQLDQLATTWPSAATPVTSRSHCIVWSGWVNVPQAELGEGIRFDTNYYYWPGTWVQDRPGLFTGSGFPQRFADTDGSLDRRLSGGHAAHRRVPAEHRRRDRRPARQRDRREGLLRGRHREHAHRHRRGRPPGADAIIEAAQARGIPTVSAKQMLTWLDGRDASSFTGLSMSGGQLSFAINPAGGARGLTAMLPVNGPTGSLLGLARNGVTVPSACRTSRASTTRCSTRPPARTWRPTRRPQARRRAPRLPPPGAARRARRRRSRRWRSSSARRWRRPSRA